MKYARPIDTSFSMRICPSHRRRMGAVCGGIQDAVTTQEMDLSHCRPGLIARHVPDAVHRRSPRAAGTWALVLYCEYCVINDSQSQARDGASM